MKNLILIVSLLYSVLGFSQGTTIKFITEREVRPLSTMRQLEPDTVDVYIFTSQGVSAGYKITPKYKVLICTENVALEGKVFDAPPYFVVDNKRVDAICHYELEPIAVSIRNLAPNWEFLPFRSN